MIASPDGVEEPSLEPLGPLCVRLLGHVDHHDADTGDLPVDPDRVVAHEPLNGPALVVGTVGAHLDVEDGLAGLEHLAVDRFELRPELGDRVGDRPAELVYGSR